MSRHIRMHKAWINYPSTPRQAPHPPKIWDLVLTLRFKLWVVVNEEALVETSLPQALLLGHLGFRLLRL